MSDIKEVLVQRGNRYGDFAGHAAVTQALKAWAKKHRTYCGLPALLPYQQEALDMIFHKIGRIVNGDPSYDDSWIDIAGYAQLVVDQLHKDTPHA